MAYRTGACTTKHRTKRLCIPRLPRTCALPIPALCSWAWRLALAPRGAPPEGILVGEHSRLAARPPPHPPPRVRGWAHLPAAAWRSGAGSHTTVTNVVGARRRPLSCCGSLRLCPSHLPPRHPLPPPSRIVAHADVEGALPHLSPPPPGLHQPLLRICPAASAAGHGNSFPSLQRRRLRARIAAPRCCWRRALAGRRFVGGDGGGGAGLPLFALFPAAGGRGLAGSGTGRCGGGAGRWVRRPCRRRPPPRGAPLPLPPASPPPQSRHLPQESVQDTGTARSRHDGSHVE